MYPEAGGSSSFARRAFNEFWSFFAAWAQMLTYVATIATSAFFVPHYLGGLFWDELSHSPGDVIFTCITIAILGAINIVGVKESTGVNVAAGGRGLPHAGAAGAGRRSSWSSTRRSLVDNVHSASRRRGRTSSSRSRSGCSPTRASRRSRTCPRRPRTRPRRSRRRSRACAWRCSRSTSRCRRSRSSALPVEQDADGEYVTLLGLPGGGGRLRGRPGAGRRARDGPRRRCRRRRSSTSACWPRRSCSWPPTPGLIGISRLVYSMGIHRQLPDRAAAAAPEVPHAVDRDHRLQRLRDPRSRCPARRRSSAASTPSARCCRSRSRTSRVIRLRMTKPDFPRPYKGPGNVTWRGVDVAAVRGRRRRSFTAIAFVVIVVLQPDVALVRRRLAGARHGRLPRSTAARRAWT